MNEQQNSHQDNWQEVKAAAGEAVTSAGEVIKGVKEKYEQASPKTQTKVKKGLLGAGIALIGLIGLRKLFKRK